MSRCDHLRQNDNNLDEEIKTVSARQTHILEFLWNRDTLCCRPKLVVNLIAQKLSSVLPLAC